MSQILITLQIFIVLALVVLVFIQKSDDEGVANLTNSSGGMSKKSHMNFISKVTIIVAFAFMINSVAMARLENVNLKRNRAIIHEIEDPNNESKTDDFSIKIDNTDKGNVHIQNHKNNEHTLATDGKDNEQNKTTSGSNNKNKHSNLNNIPLVGQTENTQSSPKTNDK